MFSNTVVILAAGRGNRMNSDKPKVLLEVAGKPLIQHVIDFWKDQGMSKFIFVVGYEAESVLRSLRLDWPCSSVIQKEQKGIAHAILQAEKYVPEKFIVSLGDCLNIGKFDSSDGIDSAYGLWFNEYHKQLELCCSARVENDRIVRIIEKARAPYVGMGTYFFNRRIFNYIRETEPSNFRHEVEITDVIQNAIDAGELFKPVYFYGDFINCTYPKDIEEAERLLKQGVK